MGAILDLTLGEITERTDAFGAAMRTQFHLPPDELDPLDADESWIMAEQPDAKRSEQLVTLLEMLGYLDAAAADESVASRLVDAALAHWERDYAEALRRDAIEIRFDEAERAQLGKLPWEQRRIRELKALATFEGEVALKHGLPAAGETSLASRLVHLRLRSYGLARVTGANATQVADTFATDAPFGAASLHAIRHGLRIFLKNPAGDGLELVNLLGNAPAATDTFLATNGAWTGLYRNTAEDGEGAIGRNRVLVFTTRERRWTREGDHWVFRQEVKAPGRLPEFTTGGKIAEDQLEQTAQHPNTIVGLELLQLRLWMMGYYLGAVDGDWGALSVDALDRFAAENAELVAARKVDEKDLSSPRFRETYRRCGRDHWCLLNLGRILTVIVDGLDAVAERLSGRAMDRVAEESVAHIQSEQDWAKIETAYAAHRARERTQIEAPVVTTAGGLSVDKRGHGRRRRYFGWRRFFAAAGAFLRKVGGKIVAAFDFVISALKQGFGQAFEILRYLWRKVRVAVRIARLAVRRLGCWLAGTPITTARDGEFSATRWSLDFDTVNLVSERCPPDLQALHLRRIHWMNASFTFMSRLGLFVLGLIAKAVTAWLLIAHHIYRFVRSLLADESLRGVYSEDILEHGII